MSYFRFCIVNLFILICACIILQSCNDDLNTLDQVSSPILSEDHNPFLIFQSDGSQMGWHTSAVVNSGKGELFLHQLTAGRLDFTPDISYDKKWIVYIHKADGEADYRIWKMKANGEGKRALTPLGKSCQRPRFSKDGSKIVFVLTEANRSDICIIDSSGGNWQQLTSSSNVPFYSTTLFNYPDFDPSGNIIVCSYKRTDLAKMGLATLNAVTHEFVYIHSADDFYPESPRWSPLGGEIIFTGEVFSFEGPKLFKMKSDGSNLKVIYSKAWGVYCPDWENSNSASRIAFAKKDSLNGFSSIWAVDENGNNERLEYGYYNENCTEPSW
ncbi:MAG: TolB family protein [Clostridiales bacterium]